MEADSSGSVYARAIPYDTDLDLDIALTGTTKDTTDGSDNILVGQYCTASPVLTHCPSGYSVTGYQWSVSGTTFQTWSPTTPDYNQVNTPAYDSSHTYFVGGDGDETLPALTWYWNDPLTSGATQNETVSCMVTLHSSSGPDLTVTATKQVTVWEPTWTATGTGGRMEVSIDPYITTAAHALWATSLPGSVSKYPAGMIFSAGLSSPDLALFADGQISLLQIITANENYTVKNDFGFTVSHPNPENGIKGLDISFPYSWWDTSVPDAADAPGFTIDGGTNDVQTASLHDSFEDYIMFQPPGSGEYVPLGKFEWNADGDATKPSGGWVDNFAGTVSSSGSPTAFTKNNTFPMWTHIVTASPF